MDRALRSAHAFGLLSFALVTWSAGPGDPAHLVLALGQLVLAGLVAFVGERRWHVVVGLAMMLWSALPEFRAETDLSDGLALATVLLSAMRTLDRPRYVSVAVAAVCLDATLRLALGAVSDLPPLICSYALTVTYTYVAGALVESLEQSTRRLDRSEARSAAARVRAIETQERERAVSAAVRVLHDDVLNALRNAEADGLLPAPRIRHDAASAVAAVKAFDEVALSDEPSHADPFEVLLHGLTGAATLPLDFEYDVEGPVMALTAVQLEAASRALTEAVRNVERHADATRIDVRVHGRPDRFSFAVIDDGRGFAADASEGLGIRHSIRAAVAEADGRVEVSSSETGSRVEVVFTSAQDRAVEVDVLSRAHQLTLDSGGDVDVVRTTMVPLAAVWLAIGTWYAIRAPDRWESCALLILITLLPVAVVRRFRRRAPTISWLLGFAAYVSVLQVIGLVLLPDGGLLDLRSWHLGFLTTPLVVVAFLVPAVWGWGLIGLGVALVSVVSLIRPELSNGQFPVSALNSLILTPTLTVILGIALRRNGVAVERERLKFLAVTTEEARRRSLANVGAVHLDHTRRVVVPWLRALARGDLEVSSPAVQSQARRLARETRDDLHAPGFYSPGLRRVVGDFRARGGRVEISPEFPRGAFARPSGRLLDRLVQTLPPDHRIGLSHGGPGVRLVITPPPSASVLEQLELPPRARRSLDDYVLALEFEEYG